MGIRTVVTQLCRSRHLFLDRCYHDKNFMTDFSWHKKLWQVFYHSCFSTKVTRQMFYDRCYRDTCYRDRCYRDTCYRQMLSRHLLPRHLLPNLFSWKLESTLYWELELFQTPKCKFVFLAINIVFLVKPFCWSAEKWTNSYCVENCGGRTTSPSRTKSKESPSWRVIGEFGQYEENTNDFFDRIRTIFKETRQ